MKNHETVLVKVYRGPDRTVDRSSKSVSQYSRLSLEIDSKEEVLKFHHLVSTSSSSSLAPTPLLRFQNGYAYTFIHGQVCYSLSSLTPKMVWKAIAREIARWHTLLPVVDLEFVVERGKGYEGLPDVGPNIWTRAREWIEGLSMANGEQRRKKEELEREFEWLVEKLEARSLSTEQVRGSDI